MKRNKIVCPDCGREISKSNFSKHQRRHKNHPETFFVREALSCRFCGKECKNNNSLSQHEIRCKSNPNHIDIYVDNFNKKGRVAWNKGLSKDVDIRLAKHAEKVSKTLSGRKGKPHTEATKLKISESRKKYLTEHPEKVPYIINHSSKTSYPEQYFLELFEKENIDLTYHFQINKYQLDFADVDKKIDIEIDGDQHFLDKRILNSDKERDRYLSNLGWTIFRIKWSDYKSFSYNDKVKIINSIKDMIG